MGIPWDTTGATYYTLVIVRDNANVSAYMNYSNDGDLELLGVSTATDNDPIVAPNGYQIGYCLPRNGGSYLDALVHSFTFWDNAALTLEEIYEQIDIGYTPEPEPEPEPEPQPELEPPAVIMNNLVDGIVYSHSGDQTGITYDNNSDGTFNLNWDSDWELRASFKQTATFGGPARLISFSIQPLSDANYIEIQETGKLLVYNGDTHMGTFDSQNPAGNFVVNTHYYMSMYYDVVAQTLKISYQTDAEFSHWSSLRSISSGNTTTHDLSSGPPNGILNYTMYLGNTSRNYDRPWVGWIDFLEISSAGVANYPGTNTIVSNSDVTAWAGVSNNGNRYRSNNAAYHYDNVNDGNADTFWISGNNTDETIGIYFNEMQELVGFGLKWPNTSITGDNVHLQAVVLGHCIIHLIIFQV